jgi:ribosomal protein S6--L-glutamate ligase
MRIGILSQDGALYSTRRLREAAEARGHEARVIDYMACSLSVASGRPGLHFRGEPLPGLDAVVPRIGASRTFYGTAVVRQLEAMGVRCLNGSQAIARSRDKLCCLQILARAGLDLPVTGFAHSSEDAKGMVGILGGPPLVVKMVEGTQGIGVVLAGNTETAGTVIEAFRGQEVEILVQEFIEEAGGVDLRALVVGGEVAAAMARQAPPGEFRSNLHQGGKALPVRLDEEERRAALRAAHAVGLNVAGVDLLRSDRGPLVLEVNSSPGLEGIEGVSGVDVAGAMVRFLEGQIAQEE